MHYSIVTIEGQESLTALIDGVLRVATSAHPSYDAIKEGVFNDDHSVGELFDLSEAVNSAFGEVTDRVTVNRDGVLLDGAPVHGAISKVLMSLVEQGERDGFIGLARFLERLSDNPSHRSREQLYNFVEANDISIDKDGHLVLYKSVAGDSEGGFRSHAIGTAWVNGVEYAHQQIPTNLGDVVTMPRREISDDPTVACHKGLHAGAHAYAQWFHSGSTILRVLVGPEHVVSVPVDSDQQKIRTEQYTIGDVVTRDMPTYWRDDYEYDDEEDDYDDLDDEDEDYDVEDEPSVWPYNTSW